MVKDPIISDPPKWSKVVGVELAACAGKPCPHSPSAQRNGARQPAEAKSVHSAAAPDQGAPGRKRRPLLQSGGQECPQSWPSERCHRDPPEPSPPFYRAVSWGRDSGEGAVFHLGHTPLLTASPCPALCWMWGLFNQMCWPARAKFSLLNTELSKYCGIKPRNRVAPERKWCLCIVRDKGF